MLNIPEVLWTRGFLESEREMIKNAEEILSGAQSIESPAFCHPRDTGPLIVLGELN